jgi:hypothetical protein
MGAISYTDDLLRTIESVIANSMETTQARTENYLQTMQGYLDIVTANRQELMPETSAQAAYASAQQPVPTEEALPEGSEKEEPPALEVPESSFFNKDQDKRQ